MSIKAMSWVWDNSPYEGVGLLVHLALADFADDQGVCWPSQKRISDKCKSSERHVRRIIKQMIEDGQILLVEKSNGVTTNNRYRLLMDRTSRPALDIGQDLQDMLTGQLSPVATGHRSPANHHITINNRQRSGPPEEVKKMMAELRRRKRG